MTALYKDGTITLVNGSPVITGNDTAWAVSLIVGGTVFVEVDGGNPLPILPDDGGAANLHPITDTQMTSAINWTGPSGTFNYALVRDMSYTRQQSINAEKLGDLLSQLDNPLLAALSSIEGLQDHLILLTGPSTATIIPRSSLVEGVDYDVPVNTLADLAAYSGEVKDFSVLVADAGNGRAALFIKRSNTDGDWLGPYFITGAGGQPGQPGPFTTIQIGDTATLNPGQSATVTMTPVSPSVVRLDFGLPRGTNGTGTGDVVGPAVSVNNRVALFDGTTGKLLKDSGVLLGNAASRNVGTTAGTVAAGDDARFSQGGSSQNEAIFALDIADLKGSRLGMKGGVADAFDDETGVDVKTNAVYDAANDWYVPNIGGGTAGGSASTTGPNTVARNYTGIDRGYSIPGGTVVQKVGVFATAAMTGKIKIALEVSTTQYSIVVDVAVNHPGGGWADVSLPTPYTIPSTGTYRMGAYFSGSGTTANYPATPNSYILGDAIGSNIGGFTAESSAGSAVYPTRYTYNQTLQNMTLISVAYPLPAVPANGRLVLQTVEFDAAVANTDFVAEFSRDNGTTWTAGNLVLSPYLAVGNYKMYEAQPFSVASQPSGSAMKWRARTLTNKNIAISGIVSQGA
jgi:hypothetical protein